MERLTAGSSATLTITTTIATGSAGQELSATALLTSLDGNDRNPANDQQSVLVVVPRVADLSVTGLADIPRPAAGQTLVLDITASNGGPDAATNAITGVSLPPELTYVSHSQSQGSYEALTGTWTIGTLGSLSDALLQVTVRVADGLAGDVLSTGLNVSSDILDPDESNNSEAVDVTVAMVDLEITKVVDNPAPSPGETVVFTIAVNNHGPDAAELATISDVLPAGLTFISAVPTQGTFNELLSVWDLGALASGSTATLLLTVHVTTEPDGDIVNTASLLSVLPLDPVTANNQDSATITIAGLDVVVNAAVNDSTPDAGDQVTLSYDMENLGPLNASGLTADIVLPSGLAFVSAATAVGAYDNATGVWTVGTMLQGESGTLQVIADVVPGTAGQTMNSTVSVATLDQTDLQPTNNTASVSLTITEIQLSLTKSVDNPTPSQGSSVTFTLLVSNSGPDTATRVAVGDTLPTGLTYVSNVAERGIYDQATGLWDVGTIALGETARLDIVAVVDIDVGGGDSVENHAWIIASDQEDLFTGDDHDSAALTLASADLHLTAVVDDSTPAAGDAVQYTLTLRNDGPGTVSGVVVRDSLVDGLTYQSHAPAGPGYDPITGFWDVGDLAIDESRVLTLNALVDTDRSGAELTTTPTITFSDQADPDGTDNSAPVTLSVLAADVLLSWTAVPDPTVGDTLLVQLSLEDLGPDILETSSVSITNAPGMTFLDASPSDGVFNVGVWELSLVAPLTEVTLDIRMIIEPGTIGSELWIGAETTDARPGDPSPDVGPSQLLFTVRGADLVLNKTANVTQTHEGEIVLYTLTVRNDGPDPTSGVVVLDTLPSMLAYTTHIPNWADYNPVNGRWLVGDLDVGESASLFLQAHVGTVSPGDIIVNSATIEESILADGDPFSDVSSIAVVVPSADLSLGLEANVPSASIGQEFILTATTTNNGPDDASGLVVGLPLPSGLEFISADSPDYDAVAGNWVIGDLPETASALLDLTVRVAQEAAGDTLQVTTTVIEIDQGDPDPLNNSATTRVPIMPNADLSVGLASGVSWVDVGDTLIWTVSLINTGPNDASSITVSDDLPSGMSVVDWRADVGTYDSANHLWHISELGFDQNLNLELSVIVPVGFGGDDHQGTAQIVASATPDHNDHNNIASEMVHVTGVDLSLDSWVDLEAPGEGDDVIITFSVGNLGPDVATGVAMMDSLPVGLTYVSHTPPAENFTQISEGQWAWDVGTVEAQTPRVLFLRTKVDEGTTGLSLRHVATIEAGPEEDTNATNNSTLNLLAVSGTDLVLDLAVNDLEPAEGDTVTAVLTLTNVGPLAASGIVVANVVATGLVFVDATPAESYEPATSQWTIEAVPAGESSELQLRLLVDERTGGMDLTISTEVIASDQVDPTPSDAAASSTMNIAIPGEGLILLSEIPLPNGTARPLGEPTDVLALQLVNWSVRTDTLAAVTFHDISSVSDALQGVGLWVELDSEWVPLQTELRPLVDGVAVLDQLNLVFNPGDTLNVAVRGVASIQAADAAQLGVSLETASDFDFTSNVSVETAEWPISTTASIVVDGFVAAQAWLEPVPAGVLVPGEPDRIVLRVTLPANGGMESVLHEIQLMNMGTARPNIDLSAVEIWLDDGDATRLDDPVGEAVWTGDRWRLSGLELVVPAHGLNLFVTADTAPDAEGQRSVQMSVPVNGVDMDGGNDGPLDSPLVNPFTLVIGGSDHLYLAAVSRPWVSARTDGSEELLLHLTATNTFEAERVVTSLRVTGLINSLWSEDQALLDGVVGPLVLYADADDNGIPGDNDDVIGASTLVTGEALFGGLDWRVPSAATRHLFLKVRVSEQLAADGDMISMVVASAVDVQLAGNGLVAGNWPLDGGGGLTVDGFLASRIDVRPGVTRLVAPGEVNQLIADWVVPGNGHSADVLNSLSIVNQGTATKYDMSGIRLWLDGGDAVFSADQSPPGDDISLASLIPAQQHWSVSDLSLAVSAAGARLYLSADISSMARDSASVDIQIPVGGLEYASDGDGPLDVPVAAQTVVLVNRSDLMTNMALSHSDAVVGQDISLAMNVVNSSTLPVTDVTPEELTFLGDGGIEIVSGPTPALTDLDPGEQVEFTWLLRSGTVGQSQVVASVSGVNAGMETIMSLPIASQEINTVQAVTELQMSALSQLPPAVNAGQTGVSVLTLNLNHSGVAGSSTVQLDSLTVRLRTATGAPLDFDTVLSRVSLRFDGRVVADVDISSEMGPLLTLSPNEELVLEPQSQGVLTLDVEISDPDPGLEFSFAVENSDLAARDPIAGNSVQTTLVDGNFPVVSGITHVVAGASALAVRFASEPALQASLGQQGVRLGSLQLTNPGDPESGAGLQLGVINLTLLDGNNDALALPSDWISSISVRHQGQSLATQTIHNGDSALLVMALETPLSIAAGSTEELKVIASLNPESIPGSVGVGIFTVNDWDVRDSNTSASVPIELNVIPELAPAVSIVMSAELAHLGGRAAGAGVLTAGAGGQPILELDVRHPGLGNIAGVAVDSLTFSCFDEAGMPLNPTAVFERLSVRLGSTVVGTVIVPENADGKVRLALTGAVVEPGGVLQLNVAVDVRVGALDAFTVLVDLPDVRTVDVHLRTPVMLTPDSGVALPLSSGLRSIRLAADELVLAARDVMPATIAAFDTDVPAIELDFTSTALGSAGDLLVTQLNLTAVSSSKSESALGTIVSGFVVTDGEHEWGRSEQLVVGDTVASVMGDLGLLLEPGETRTLHVLLKLASGVQTGSVSVGLDLGGVVVRQPEGELVPVRVLAASGQIFPFLTLPGGVTPASLEQSYSNYPNPFAAGRETTTFVFGLAAAATVDLRIYTPRGELVRVLLDGEQRSVGLHQDVLWDGRNGRGDPVRNGVFIAEIIVRKSNGGFVTLRRKVAVVR